MKRSLLTICRLTSLALLLNGCMVGPKYSGQIIEVPQSFDRQALDYDAVEYAEWWKQFRNPPLDVLINKALKNNRDIAVAASRIVQGRLAVGIANADLLPQLDYRAGISRGDFTGGSQLPSTTNSIFLVGSINWELDFWGKYRNARNVSLAQLLASEYSHYSISLLVESETARLYFQLLDYRKRLNIAQSTLAARAASVDIIRQRFEKGVVPEIDLSQAVIQEADAAVAVPLYEQLVIRTQNALLSLLGEMELPVDSFQGELSEQVIPSLVPEALPSNLLQRRPDILEAEQTLIAQYAFAGIAQSLRFPAISLTSAGGYASDDLSNFLRGSPTWSVGSELFGPIFHFGSKKKAAEIELEKIEEARAKYEQTVINAFLEVNNALAEIKSLEQQLKIKRQQLEAARNAARLSLERYNGGVTSYLELLDSERVLFAVELSFSQTNQELLSSYVTLYKALGGGWKVEAP